MTAMPAEDAAPDDPGPPPHPARSRLLTGALLAVGVVAVAVLGALLLGRREDPRPPAGPSWSAWQPAQDGPEGAAQIARHVSPRYRGPDGRPLVLVTGGALEVSGLPLTVAVRSPGGAATPYGGKAVLYRLCGRGRGCATPPGRPSIERHLLLRREALELALYSLRYLDDVEAVVVFMPPRKGDQPSQALFFRKDRVRDEIAKPLDATLVDRAPTVARVTRSPDALLVEQLTIPALFRFSVAPTGQDDRTFLVLDPLDSARPAEPQPWQPAPGRANAAITPAAERPAATRAA